MDDQEISAEEFLKGDPVSAAAPAPAARTKNKFTPQQYSDYVRLVRDKNTTPDQLAGWFKDNGIGQASVNADQVLSFARRNPNARVPNLWIGVPSAAQQAAPQQAPAPSDAPYAKIPNWQKLSLSELNRQTGKNYVGLDAHGLPLEDPNHAQVTNPELPSWGQRFMRNMRETFSPSGGGVNAYLMRSGEDVRADDVIRQWGSDHNWTGKQIDDAIARAKQDRGREIADTRQQQTARDNDEAAREGGGILGKVKRGSAELAGSIAGDANPSYLFAPEIKGVSAGVERVAPAIGRALERVLPQAAARGAVPVIEHAIEAAAPTTGRMAGQGAQQGALDVATQADEVAHGIKDHVSPSEVAVHALLGSVFQGGAEALGAAAPRVAGWLGDKINPGRVANREGLNSLESDLALLTDRGIAPEQFNNVDEIRASAQFIREGSKPKPAPEAISSVPEKPSPANDDAPPLSMIVSRDDQNFFDHMRTTPDRSDPVAYQAWLDKAEELGKRMKQAELERNPVTDKPVIKPKAPANDEEFLRSKPVANDDPITDPSAAADEIDNAPEGTFSEVYEEQVAREERDSWGPGPEKKTKPVDPLLQRTIDAEDAYYGKPGSEDYTRPKTRSDAEDARLWKEVQDSRAAWEEAQPHPTKQDGAHQPDELTAAAGKLVDAAKTLDPNVEVPPELGGGDSGGGNTPPPEEPSSGSDGGSSTPPPPEEDVITRMTKAINDAGKVTTEQQQMYTEARRQRLAKVKAIRANTSGEAGFRAELAQLKGAMPRAEFAPVRDKFTQTDVDTLFNKIRDASNLTPYEQINARTALANMLDGKAPTPSEIGLLNQVFPSDFMKAVLKQRSRGRKFSEFLEQAVNLPRTLMSSVDLSAPLRQGVFLVGRKEFYKAWPAMFREFARTFKENDGIPVAQRGSNWQSSGSLVLDEIRQRPTFDLMQEAKLAITGAHAGGGLSNREEAFMSPWAEKIPGLGRVVRASENAYTGFLNKLRADTFDSLVKLHRQAGINLEFEPTVLRDIARFINSATGRGDLHGKVGQAAPMLNGLFFSPRLIKSRVDMLNPLTYINYSPIVRREAIKSLLSFGAIGTTVLGLAALNPGVNVTLDPRSSDFGKIVVGNTHFDIFGGFSQFITLGARLLTNETVTTGSHEVKTLGKDFGSPTRLNTIERFFENKAAPVPSFIMDYFRGKNAVGQDFDATNPNPMDNSVAQRFIPMFMQDLYDVVKDRGPEGLAMAVPSLFGVGVNTYSNAPNKQGFMGGTPVPQKGAKSGSAPASQPTAAPSTEPPKELTAEQFMEGDVPPDEPTPQAATSAPVPKQSTFENSIASDVLSNMGLRITDNGIRSHKDQERYYNTTHGAAPPGSSKHEIGDAIDIAVPHDVSVGDITSALEKAGLKGVDIITRRHGTAPHWHISWQGSE